MLTVFQKLISAIISFFVAASALLSTGSLPAHFEMPDVQGGEYGQYVNPFVGTGGTPWVGGMTFPGATAPFGAVRLSPDTSAAGGTRISGNWATAGYYYGHSRIIGFSHTRLSGTGVSDQQHFRVTPSLGSDPAKRLTSPLYFSHDDEVATAGYYAVNLPTIACLAEMTATAHVGVHRYTFRSAKDAHLFIDATSFAFGGGTACDGRIEVNTQSGEITGEGTIKTGFAVRYGGLKAYFVAAVNAPIASFSTWVDGVSVGGRSVASGDDTGADLCFGNVKGRAVEMKLAISFVSLENARENLAAEVGGKNFDAVRADVGEQWESWLSRIKVRSTDSTVLENFYTALYHSMIMPTDFTDVNGEYIGFDKKVSTAQGFTYRTDMSLWDTFRTTHPLYTLIAPEIQVDCLKSLVLMAQAGGSLPRWPSGEGYTRSMFGTPTDMVIAESYLKGITDFDVEAAYSFMKTAATQKTAVGRDFIDAYNAYGYCPADLSDAKSVSRTLEYAWADSSIALLASALGKTEDAAYFSQKAQNYKNLWDSDTGYFRAKNSDGSWVTPFSPYVTSFIDDALPVDFANGYCEGGAGHWRWSVPQDVDGLIELFGSREHFVDELNEFMGNASARRSALNPGYGYWHGNEHNLHAPYLFNNAGRADLTQKWVRWVLETRYASAPDGLDGSDDGGALSAWYVFSALGFYPCAGTDRYWLGSPAVDGAVVDLGGGKTLKIIVNNQSAKNVYVESVMLNGVELSGTELTHAQLSAGGTLCFNMCA